MNTDRKNTTRLAEVIAPFFDVSGDMVLSRSRKREHVEPRHLIFYYLSVYRNWGASRAARSFPIPFDHSTVIHGCKAVEDRLYVYPNYADLKREVFKKMDAVFEDRWQPEPFQPSQPPLDRVYVILYPEVVK